jgi:hypothetical protein
MIKKQKQVTTKQTIMRTQIKLILILTFTLLMTAGCSTRLVDFTVISSKNVSLDINKQEGVQVSAKSMGFLSLGVSIKDAMDEALSNAGPGYDLLVDGVVRYQDYIFVGGYEVTGTAIRSADIAATLDADEFEKWVTENNVYIKN